MTTEVDSFYGNPKSLEDFPLITVYGTDFRKCVFNMHKAITQNNCWHELIEEPPKGKGFMYSSQPWQLKVEQCPLVEGDGHSGATLGYCWRICQTIARVGWVEFCKGNKK